MPLATCKSRFLFPNLLCLKDRMTRAKDTWSPCHPGPESVFTPRSPCSPGATGGRRPWPLAGRQACTQSTVTATELLPHCGLSDPGRPARASESAVGPGPRTLSPHPILKPRLSVSSPAPLASAIFTYQRVSRLTPSVGQFLVSASCVRSCACLVCLLGLPVERSRGPREAQAGPPAYLTRQTGLAHRRTCPESTVPQVSSYAATRLHGDRGPCPGASVQPRGSALAVWRWV